MNHYEINVTKYVWQLMISVLICRPEYKRSYDLVDENHILLVYMEVFRQEAYLVTNISVNSKKYFLIKT